jgi:hypothetical protein
MGYVDEVRNCASLEKLFELWKNKAPEVRNYVIKGKQHEVNIDHSRNRFIPDGIVDFAVWDDDAHKKILYVLKEAYTDDLDGFNLASWLSGAPDIPIWKRIARWTNGLQHTTAKEIFKYDHDPSEEVYKECFSQIAVLNLKKSGGNSESVFEEIASYAEADREEIIKEFELIDADIIVCGYTFGILMDKVFKVDYKKNSNNWAYYMDLCGRERLVIDYYHPANHYPDLANYYAVTNIYQQALIEKAGK